MPTVTLTLEAAKTAVRDQLTAEFNLPRELLDKMMAREFERFTDARVRDFVPLFVQRSIREQLRVALG